MFVCVCVCVCLVCCVFLACLCVRACRLPCQELVSRKLSMMPSMEEATMVTWEELEQAITDGWRASQVVNSGGGGRGWPVILGGVPKPLPFHDCTVVHDAGILHLFHQFSIMAALNGFFFSVLSRALIMIFTHGKVPLR